MMAILKTTAPDSFSTHVVVLRFEPLLCSLNAMIPSSPTQWTTADLRGGDGHTSVLTSAATAEPLPKHCLASRRFRSYAQK